MERSTLREKQSGGHAQDELSRSGGGRSTYTSVFMAKEVKAKRSDLARVPHLCSFLHTVLLPRFIKERKEEGWWKRGRQREREGRRERGEGEGEPGDRR